MTDFVYHGPLDPDSRLFQGRRTELEQLLKTCRERVRYYTIVYGGRQTGKTSLILRLSRELGQLPEPIPFCRVDFQSLPGASTEQAIRFLCYQISNALKKHNKPINARQDEAPEEQYLADWLVARMPGGPLVLCLEELGALPNETRDALANMIRALFGRRMDSGYESLYRLVVVLTSGIELYELSATYQSPLKNVCELIYLPDLDEQETINLLTEGLAALKVGKPQVSSLGKAIYSRVEGHPYLTQRLGAIIQEQIQQGGWAEVNVERAAEDILQSDFFFARLKAGIAEYQLEAACQELLHRPPKFARLNTAMAQLEVLGVCKPQDDRWVARNPLIRRALITDPPPPPTPRPIEVFFSYSHLDEPFRKQLETNLAILRREKAIIGWHDREISAGTNWAGQIDEHLKSADIILLLISPNFLASDYCNDVEVTRALERESRGDARVIPIILKPSSWQSTQLAGLQALPKDGKPITTWNNRDTAWLNVEQGLRKVVNELIQRRTQGESQWHK